MREQLLLDSVRKAMIERRPETFTEGNVHVVAYAVSPPQVSNESYQVYPAGSSFDADGGGNLRRRMSFGVRIWNRVLGDQMSIYRQLGEQMASRAREVLIALHQHYEPEADQQEPFIAEGQSPNRTQGDGDGTYAYCDITFRTSFASSYSDVRDAP